MPPFLALLLWFAFLLWLLLFDPAKQAKPSLALWVPLLWLFIVGSRLPSQWLNNQIESASEASMEGNSVDRVIYCALIVLAIRILTSRRFNWGDFITRNSALMILLVFAFISVFWSDFPFISLKRWLRDLGNYLAILVVLSDPDPLEAIRVLLRRLCYLLIPLSILLIKYFPYMGRHYGFWSAATEYVGATTSKNMLGVLCLISGIFFFWDTVNRWSDRRQRQARRIIFLNIAFIGLTFWLLSLSNSATSRVCLLLGFLVIAAAHRKTMKRNPSLLKALIPISLAMYMTLQYTLDISGQLAGMVGRDATFTGRTVIWSAVLSTHTNPLIGTGYESFWLGPRLQTVWRQTGVPINEAHNGYLEVYLNLGCVGLVLLGGFLFSSYRTVCRRLTPFSSFGSLSLALWTVLLFYNATEAAFRGQLMWVVFLLVAMIAPPALNRRGSLPAELSATEKSPDQESRHRLREVVGV